MSHSIINENGANEHLSSTTCRKPRLFTRWLLLAGTLFIPLLAQGQISGRIADQTDSTSLPGVVAVLTNNARPSEKLVTTTDADGKFSFNGIKGTDYQLKISFMGYKDSAQNLKYNLPSLDLGTLYLINKNNVLKEIVVTGQAPTAVQKGDTTEMNASAFKVNPDANAHDLIEKMPGVTVENGTVKSNGEEIKKIMIDGKAYFGDDVAMALKNLPADVIDKVQVYNKMSDQAQFTGFDDGQSAKVINIITRPDRRNGTTGQFNAGHDFENHYIGSGRLNLSKNQRRLTITGLSNNINQQNFTTQDMLGVLSGSGGINTTHMAAINYNSTIKNITISGTYSFNNQRNTTERELNREYMLAPSPNQFYNQTRGSESNNYNHRFDIKLEVAIDSANTLMWNPRGTTQKNLGNSNSHTYKYYTENSAINQSDLASSTSGNAYTYTSDFIVRHKFRKPGRTIAIGFTVWGSNQTFNEHQYAIYQYFTGTSHTDTTDLKKNSEAKGFRLSPNLTYTEPVGMNGLFQLNYSPSFSNNSTDKYSYDQTVTPAIIDTLTSNVFNNQYNVQRFGSNYRFKSGKSLQGSIGLDYQKSKLDGDQHYPRTSEVNKTFENILPNFMLVYNFSAKTNFKFQYRTLTTEPTIAQLQNVVNNSNPLYVSSGNPDLKQVYSHQASSELKFANPKRSITLNLRIYGGLTQNMIGNSTFIAGNNDTIIQGRIALKPGAQLTMPVNIGQDSWNLNSSLTYGIRIKPIKCNLNTVTSGGYATTPRFINKKLSTSNVFNLMNETALTSNINQYVDFSLRYNISYRNQSNSIQESLNTQTWNHVISFRSNFIFWKKLVLQNSVAERINRGMAGGYNKDYIQWDFSVGKKLFKYNAGELRVSMYDVLNQNDNISHTATDTYIEDSRTNTFKRHLMFSFIYNIRAYKSGNKNRTVSNNAMEKS